ncbi:Ca2+-binding RTX toxin-like protein [Bradyrhizobium diazoefficiens]
MAAKVFGSMARSMTSRSGAGALSASEIAALWNDGAGQPVGSATIPNNAAPAITSNGGGETAAISIMENTSAVTTVEATDPDAAQALSYSISGGADAFWFAIDPTSGALSFKTAPDFENPTDADPDNVYNVTVQVSDGNGGTDTQAVAVTVQNVAGSTINGTNKVNTLTGSGEEDFLYGKGGNDNLQGLGGNDYLDGGSGKDTMNGGAGADRFVFSAFADSTIANFDIVQGFVHGIDMIDIAGIDANASKKGDQAFVFAGQNSSAIANSATWYESGGNTFVQADVNGNTTADLLIQLTGTNLGLSASDFLL